MKKKIHIFKPKAKKVQPKKKNIKKAVKKAKVEKPRSEEIKFGLFNLKSPLGSHKRKKILGRGPSSGHGRTSTRGSKGQTSRAGRDFYLGFEGGQSPLIRRIPKRGFTNRFKKEYQIVNLSQLSKLKEANITLDLLKEKGLIKDTNKLVKILGDGEIKSPITICAHAFSKKASEDIKNAGGKTEIVNV